MSITTNEADLQSQCNNYLRKREITYFHLQKGRTNGQRFTQSGGLPDLLLWHKGKHCLIELKTDTGDLNKAQKVFFPQLDNAGFPVQVVRTLDDFIRAVCVFFGDS